MAVDINSISLLFRIEKPSSFSSVSHAPDIFVTFSSTSMYFTVLGRLKPVTALQMWSHKCQEERKKHMLSQCICVDGSHCHNSMWLTHVKLVCQDFQVPSSRTAPQPVSPNACDGLSQIHPRYKTPCLFY